MGKFFSFLLSLSFFVLCSFSLTAQQNESDAVPESYLRNSLTVFYIDNIGTDHWSKAREKVKEIVFSDKYDNHNMESIFFRPPATLEAQNSQQHTSAFRNELIRSDIAKQIIAKWYNRNANGMMDMQLVHQRGRFAATDADFIVAASTQRGDAALEDMGNRLVNKSFILLLDVRNIVSMEQTDNDELKGWTADVRGHLYKVDFNEEIRRDFYETWIYEDDSPEEKNRKREAYNRLEIPLEYITSVNTGISSTQTRRFGKKSEDQLLVDLMQKSMDEVLYNLERDVEDFKVVTPLYGRRPLRAKIGLKEGLLTDHRFYVYEHVYNRKNNAVEPVMRGVIRADKRSRIHDNRHEAFGDMGTSRFYQVAGRRLNEGYTLVQRNDLGFELLLAGTFGEISGGYGRLDLRTGRFTGIRAFFIYAEGGIDAQEYTLMSGTSENFTFIRFGAGLAKGLQFTRNIELRPYVGLGIESASSDTFSDDDQLSAYYVKVGANMAVNLKNNFQLVFGIGTYGFVSDAETVNEIPLGPWNELFPGRSGPSILTGVKFMF